LVTWHNGLATPQGVKRIQWSVRERAAQAQSGACRQIGIAMNLKAPAQLNNQVTGNASSGSFAGPAGFALESVCWNAVFLAA
jgi:primosomal replication protein N